LTDYQKVVASTTVVPDHCDEGERVERCATA
jgi:hypothetical protein